MFLTVLNPGCSESLHGINVVIAFREKSITWSVVDAMFYSFKGQHTVRTKEKFAYFWCSYTLIWQANLYELVIEVFRYVLFMLQKHTWTRPERTSLPSEHQERDVSHEMSLQEFCSLKFSSPPCTQSKSDWTAMWKSYKTAFPFLLSLKGFLI